jgi:prepilin-type N-terminal cleavage/methylation domain-containing protein
MSADMVQRERPGFRHVAGTLRVPIAARGKMPRLYSRPILGRLGGACLLHGFTLMELVVAMVASAVLMAGLGSVMLIARQIAYTPAASTHRLQAAEVFDELADELRFATYVIERSPTAIEFVVADRNGDGLPERIRYAWSGTAGDPLEKTVNGGTPAVLLDAVEQFQFAYTVDTDTTTIASTTQTAEALLVGNPNAPNSTTRVINATSWSAQQINPAAFAAPTGTQSWRPTRVEFYCKSATAVESVLLLVQLRSAGDPNGGPTSGALSQATISGKQLPAAPGWFSLAFPGPGASLSLHRKYALVWQGLTAAVCLLNSDTNASSGVLETEDAGASWTFMPKQVFYRLYGTYATPGPDYDIPRNRLTGVLVALQIGAQVYSRLETRIHPVNRPEILAAYWRADFDHDPTADDVNGDTVADWLAVDTSASEVASPAPYDPDTLINGIWYASGKLSTQPTNDFATTTIAEVSFRDTVPNGSGAVMRVNADWSGSLWLPLVLRVKMATDGTQTLTLSSAPDGAPEVVLFQQDGLPSGFVRCRLTILPDNNLVNIEINNEDQGTYACYAYAATGTERVVSLFGDTGQAEFDYAEVRVLAD